MWPEDETSHMISYSTLDIHMIVGVRRRHVPTYMNGYDDNTYKSQESTNSNSKGEHTTLFGTEPLSVPVDTQGEKVCNISQFPLEF
jgi:hypothetical protein